MHKNIVICSDGTGNTAVKGRGTNVFKLYEAVDMLGHLSDRALSSQIAFYDDGVGTEELKPLKLLGGALGWGLSRNVRELYAALVRSYNPHRQDFCVRIQPWRIHAEDLGWVHYLLRHPRPYPIPDRRGVG